MKELLKMTALNSQVLISSAKSPVLKIVKRKKMIGNPLQNYKEWLNRKIKESNLMRSLSR